MSCLLLATRRYYRRQLHDLSRIVPDEHRCFAWQGLYIVQPITIIASRAAATTGCNRNAAPYFRFLGKKSYSGRLAVAIHELLDIYFQNRFRFFEVS